MDAQTAYELAKEAYEMSNRKALEDVRRAIHRRAARGRTCVTYAFADLHIRALARRMLLDDGYTVDDLDGGKLLIDWGRP